MLNSLLTGIGKIISKSASLFNLGNGSTWPGHIALNINPQFIKQILSKSDIKIILVAGTNGKTTTSSLISNALKQNRKTIIRNKSGANLLNGIASTLISYSDGAGKIKKDFAIFEVDENTIPQILAQITPDYLLLLNLFRDQLDRYGEINTIAENWKSSLQRLTSSTTLILNADDPLIANLGQKLKAKIKYFSCNDLSIDNYKNPTNQASDSGYCPNCGEKLNYKRIIFSHLGDWLCPKCNLKKPKPDIDNFSFYPLSGVYNKYNTHAAVLTLKQNGLTDKKIEESFKTFKPAFGRQEEIFYKGKKIQVFLSKNPTSFNQSFQTIKDMKAVTILIILNDRIPDGRDISWIWDVDLKGIENFKNIYLSGDRVYDMALRLKYELGIKDYELKVKVNDELKKAIDDSVQTLNNKETLFILPTYSAMLDARKILTGKKIL